MPLFKRILLCLWLAWLTPVIVQASNGTLSVGFFPYTAQNKLLAHQKNLTNYLQQKMHQKLSIQVADNMAGFVSKIDKAHYDIIFTPPHVARYSEEKLGFQRIAMTTHTIRAVYVVHRDAAINDLNDLYNKTIVMASPYALLTQDAKEQFRKQGLIDKKTVSIKTASSHKNAIFSVLHHEADAAVTGIKLWNSYDDSHKKYLKILAYGEPLPGMMIMGSKRLSHDTIVMIQRYLLEFANSPQGKDYIFQGFKAIDDQTMQHLDTYIGIFQ